MGAQKMKKNPALQIADRPRALKTITYRRSNGLFKMQAALGQYEGKRYIGQVGRFGPYVKWGERIYFHT